MKSKFIVPLLLASVAGGVALTSVNNLVVRADETQLNNLIGNSIEVTGFNDKGEVGKDVVLPEVRVLDENGDPNGSAVLKLVDPSGKDITSSIQNGSFQNGSFIPNLKGYYTLSYSTTTAEGQIKTIANDLKIYVEGADYTVSLPINSKHVIPAIIPTGLEVKVPMPKVFEGEEELKVEDIVTTDANNGLKVSVSARDIANSNTALTYNAEGGYYSWTPTKADIYEISYRYLKDGKVQETKTQRVVVKEASDYNVNNIELGFSFASSRPTSAVVGVETQLPRINIVDKKKNTAIEAYTHIKVVHVDSNGNATDIEVNDFKFTPSKLGNYFVTYQAQLDLFGLKSIQSTFSILDVKDTVAPEVRVVNDYTINEATGEVATVKNSQGEEIYNENWDKVKEATEKEKQLMLYNALSDLTSDITSITFLKPSTDPNNPASTAQIFVPAIYGTDNFDKYSDLTIERQLLRSATNSTTVIEGNPFESTVTTVRNSGEYTVIYKITDKAGKSKSVYHKVNVLVNDDSLKDSNNEYYKPTIEFGFNTSTIKTNETLRFTPATAVDSNRDTSVKVKTYYYFDEDFAGKVEFGAAIDGKHELNIKDAMGENTHTKLNIYVEAFNDYNSIPATLTREIKLIDTNNAVAPSFIDGNQFLTKLVEVNNLEEFYGAGATIDAAGQLLVGGVVQDTTAFPIKTGENVYNNTIKLPSLIVEEDLDSFINAGVRVTTQDGTNVRVVGGGSPIQLKTVDNKFRFEIPGGQFEAIYSGVYNVTYYAKDSSGNTIVKTFGIKVKDVIPPTLTVGGLNSLQNVEVGKIVNIPPATLRDGGKIIEAQSGKSYENRELGVAGVYWRIENITGTHQIIDADNFRVTSPGKFLLIYEGWDKAGNKVENRTHTFTATDTNAPTIVLKDDTNNVFSLGVDFVENEAVEFPGVERLYDGGYDDLGRYFEQSDEAQLWKTLDVVVKNASGSIVETFNKNVLTADGNYSFVPTSNGVYTVIYTVTDENDLTSEITRTIEVGDVNKPTIEWNNQEEDVIRSAKLGESFVLDLEKAVISDIEDGTDLDIVVEMRDPDTIKVDAENTSDKKYKYTFDKVGDYKITIRVTDKSNNTFSETYTVTVSEETAKEQLIKPWVGTTLIVTTSVLLAGVVLYFVVTGRDGKLRTSKNKNKRRTIKK